MDTANLTRIHVRGKRADPRPTKPNAPRGNRMKRPEELANNGPATRRKVTHDGSEQASTQRQARRQFESLPPEIIEQIFALSLSPDLAGASPYVGRVVSTERIYRAFMMYAFFEDNYARLTKDPCRPMTEGDELHDIVVKSSRVDRKAFLPIEYELLDENMRLTLQKQIMSRRWFTPARLREILPKIFELSWKQQMAWEQNLNAYGPPIVKFVEPFPFESWRSLSDFEDFIFLGLRYFVPRNAMPVLVERGMTDPQLPLPTPRLQRAMRRRRHFQWYQAPFCRVSHIPNKYLLPETEDEKWLLLFSIDDPEGEARPIDVDFDGLARGLLWAVRSGNEQVVSALLDLVQFGLLQSASPQKLLKEVLPRVVPPQLFHLALRNIGQNAEGIVVIEHLLCFPFAYLILKNDRFFTKWAVDNRYDEVHGELVELAFEVMEHFNDPDDAPEVAFVRQEPLFDKKNIFRKYRRLA